MCDRFRIQTKRLLERNRCSTFLSFNSINPNRKSVMLGLNVVDETGILAIDPHSFEEFCANAIVKIRLDDQQYLSYIDNQNDTPAFIPSPRLGRRATTDVVDYLTLLRQYNPGARPQGYWQALKQNGAAFAVSNRAKPNTRCNRNKPCLLTLN